MNLCNELKYQIHIFENKNEIEKGGMPVGKGIYLFFYAMNTELKLTANKEKGVTVAKIKKSFKKDSQGDVVELAKEIFSKFDLSDYHAGTNLKEQPYYNDFNNAYKNFIKRLDELGANQLEKYGLGKGPFSFIGTMESPSKELQDKNPEAYNNALRDFPRYDAGGIGSCARCYNSITIHYNVKSSDGKIFPLGSECVGYLNDVKIETEVKKAKAELESKKRKTRDKEKTDTLEDLLNDAETIELMKNKAFPLSPSFEKWDENKQQWYLDNVVNGGTYYDWAIKQDKISGVSGKKKLLADIKKALK